MTNEQQEVLDAFRMAVENKQPISPVLYAAIVETLICNATTDGDLCTTPVYAETKTPTDYLIDRFAIALKEKLNKARIKYGYRKEEWDRVVNVPGMRDELYKHLQKGDPVDVAAYAAFLWHHGSSTVTTKPAVPQEVMEALKERECCALEKHNASEDGSLIEAYHNGEHEAYKTVLTLLTKEQK